jgi:tripartite ATP-independent transporter DctM subunit
LKLAAYARRGWEGLLIAAFLVLAILPMIDFVARPLGRFHVPGSAGYVQLLTFFLTFLGGLAATVSDEHLQLSTAVLLGDGRLRRTADFLANTAAATVSAVLAFAAVNVVLADRMLGRRLPFGAPEWLGETVMPASLAVMAIVYFSKTWRSWHGRTLAGAVALGVFALGLAPEASRHVVWPLAAALIAATLVGSPVFVAMGGLAALFFFRDGTPVSAVTAEIYRLIASPTLPAIPLLTACGYVLAESHAAVRLVRFFRALVGWMPGGVAVLVAAVCAVFTAFTGGSGVTIIALGGLVYPILREDGYPEGFSLGLVTAAGSLGLLFPPSLPVILYSVVSKVPADQLFLAGLLPGLVLVVIVALYGISVGRRVNASRQAFSLREARAATWEAKWELSIPLAMIVLFATGVASLLETAAFAVIYTIVIACFIHGDLTFKDGLPRALLRGSAMIGAVLILLSCALGMTGYLIEAQIPDRLLASVQAHIHSPLLFLLVLNGVLLVLGSVLEVFSAIIILTPLIVPLGAAYGIDPIHLGVIFLANLELGFLFPPVGLNLFLSSSRFGKPMTSLYRHVLPFLAILGGGVLLITYLPQLSLTLVKMLARP